MVIFITWFLLSFVVGAIGSERKIGFFGAFILSLVLSPLIGGIITLSSQSKSQALFQKKLLEKTNPTNINPSAEIDRLLTMKSNGDITDEEYQLMKSKIIDNIGK